MVTVLDVDLAKQRISLSMKGPGKPQGKPQAKNERRPRNHEHGKPHERIDLRGLFRKTN